MKYLKLLSLYGFTIVFNAAISFVTFSFLTHYLTQADYGIINIYSSLIAFLSPFIAIGVQYIIGIDFFTLNQDSFRKHFANAMVIPVLTTSLFTIIILLAIQSIQKFFSLNYFFTVSLPFACFLSILIDVFLNLFRNKGAHKLFSTFSILKNSLEVGLTILLVVILKYQWKGRLGASFLTGGIALIFISYLIYKWGYYTEKFDKAAISKNIRTGLPFIPERLAIFVLAGSDRFFINHFNGIATVGLYGTGAQLSVIISLGISVLNTTFYPLLFKNLEGNRLNYSKAKKVTIAYIGISAIIALGVILAIPLLFKYLIGPRFRDGQIYAINLTIGMFFWSVYNTFLPYLLIIKKNKLIMSVSIVGMVMSLCLNYINVQHFGAIGATYTSIIVYFLMAALTIYFVHKIYDIRKVFNVTYVKKA